MHAHAQRYTDDKADESRCSLAPDDDDNDNDNGDEGNNDVESN